MIAIVLLALLILLFFGAGFAVHLLWWVAIICAVIWLLGFFVRPRSNGRWYYW